MPALAVLDAGNTDRRPDRPQRSFPDDGLPCAQAATSCGTPAETGSIDATHLVVAVDGVDLAPERVPWVATKLQPETEADDDRNENQDAVQRCTPTTASPRLLEEVPGFLNLRWTRTGLDESHAAPLPARSEAGERLSIMAMTSSGRYPWCRAKATISRTLPSTAPCSGVPATVIPLSAAELEQSFVSKDMHGPQAPCSCSPPGRRQGPSRGKAITGSRLTFGDCSPELGRHLIMKRRRLRAVDFCQEHSPSDSRSILADCPQSRYSLTRVRPKDPSRWLKEYHSSCR